MENARIKIVCYWNNRIKNSSGVFELVFLCWVERKFTKNKKIFNCFWKI